MNTILLNNPTKFGAKIFRRYQVITFYVLGHFLAAPCSFLTPNFTAKFQREHGAGAPNKRGV